MSELWRASEHEPLAGEEWSEACAKAAVAAIVADAEAAFDGVRWPFHPADGTDDGPTTIYLGAAGMIWALHELGSTGWEDAAVAQIERYRAKPDYPEHASAGSYWMGECGIALVGYRLTGDARFADLVHELVLANLDSPANEVMWGAPGTALAAEAMLEWTGGESRWSDACQASWVRIIEAEILVRLPTQRIYGREWQFLGPAHGYAGMARALLGGDGPPFALLDLSPYMLREDGLVNWIPAVGAGADEIRVQWCHGAPGMVATLGDMLDIELALAAAS